MTRPATKRSGNGGKARGLAPLRLVWMLRDGVLGQMAAQRALSAQRAGDNRLAAAEYLEALRRFSGALGEQDGLTMHALGKLGWNLGALGEHAESERLYRRLLTLQAVNGTEGQDIASTHVRIGYAVYQQGRFEEAEAEYLRALQLMQTPSDLESAIQGMAAARLARAKAKEAEPFFLRLLVTEGYKSDGRWTVLHLGAHLDQSDRRLSR